MYESRQPLAMRLLLIVALIVASLGLAPSASAQPHSEVTQHSHAVHAGHQTGGQDDGEKSGAQAIAHVCPGCAFLSEPALTDADPAPAALPRLPANPTSLRSFNANPIPPPPRRS